MLFFFFSLNLYSFYWIEKNGICEYSNELSSDVCQKNRSFNEFILDVELRKLFSVFFSAGLRRTKVVTLVITLAVMCATSGIFFWFAFVMTDLHCIWNTTRAPSNE